MLETSKRGAYMKTDVVVVGGGPAGMAAACEAKKNGAKVVLIEREYRLGGILNQCIHNGFGLHFLGEELTGPEYANFWVEKTKRAKVKVVLNAVVTKIEKQKTKDVLITYQSPEGIKKLNSKAVVFAGGCREKPGPAINLCGDRPAGIFSAGEAQKIINTQGKMVGKNVVILGSGDIGLIMARRMTIEGAKVLGVYEIMPTCGGLARNVSQCLDDFNIPLFLSTSILKVCGKERVEGVVVAPVNKDFSFNLKKQKFVKCDTVLLSVGLLPETELLSGKNLEENSLTNSYKVNQFYQTSIKEFFVCGNVLHVNDLVDNVTREGLKAGEYASKFALKGLTNKNQITVFYDKKIRYVSKSYVFKSKEETSLFFRVASEMKKVFINAYSGDEKIGTLFKAVVRPNTIEEIKIDNKKLKNDLFLKVEEAVW